MSIDQLSEGGSVSFVVQRHNHKRFDYRPGVVFSYNNHSSRAYGNEFRMRNWKFSLMLYLRSSDSAEEFPAEKVCGEGDEETNEPGEIVDAHKKCWDCLLAE